MGNESVEIIPDGQIHLIDELQSLLEKQIEFARQGNINEIEVLSSSPVRATSMKLRSYANKPALLWGKSHGRGFLNRLNLKASTRSYENYTRTYVLL